MKEFPESVIAAYVDGELEPDEVRELELHLVRSREARQLVVALTEEASLLRDTLQERSREATRRSAPPVPARGMAIGLLPTLALSGVVLFLIGWAAETRIPMGLGVLNPLNWIGAYEMVFDVVFWLRDQAPGLLELGVAVAIMFSVSALLSFGVGVLFRRVVGPSAIGIAIALALAIPEPAQALDLRFHEEVVTIGASETIDETLVVSGETVYVEGVIDGDLVAFCERLVLSGEVRGDVFAFAQSVELTGRVTGSVRAGAERIEIEGEVLRDVLGGAELLRLSRGGRVARDVTAFAGNVALDGGIGRHVFAGGKRVELRGEVGGNAELRGKRVSLFDGARVAGNLDLEIAEGHEADIAAGAVVGGEVTESVLDRHMGPEKSRWLRGGFYIWLGVILASAFLVGMALHTVAPRVFRSELETSPEFFRSLGFGLVALVATPILLFLCFITIVGIPIAIIGTWIFLTALFLSLILVSALVGRAILRQDEDGNAAFGMALLLGLAVILVATNLPFIGWLLRGVVLLTGLGLFVDTVLDLWRTRPVRGFEAS